MFQHVQTSFKKFMFRLSITFHFILFLYNIYLILLKKTELIYFSVNNIKEVLAREFEKIVLVYIIISFKILYI